MEQVLATQGRSLKHVQVREYVRALVAGDAPGAPAPSERELVTRFGVARMTVRQAMDALVVEGLLERIPGRGTFVARPRRAPGSIVGLTEELARRGVTVESQTLLARREQAGPGVARALGVRERDGVLHWRRLRRADGEPICVEDVYLEEGLLPGLLDGLMPTSLYAQLTSHGLRPTWVEDAVTADAAADDEASILTIAPGAPVLRRQRRALAADRVVEVSRSVFRADRYTMRFQGGRAG